MAKLKYDGYVVYHMDREEEDDKETVFSTLDAAMEYCRRQVGNNSYSQPFPQEDTYLYGPGDGSTSKMIRRRVVGFAD